MKRVRCPKCDHFIIFDEKKYLDGQSLVFQCDECGRQFAIRIGTSRLRSTQKEENKQSMEEQLSSTNAEKEENFGSLIVIENVFHYKQVLPLQMGDNVIGRYQKGNPISTPIETVDPSVDLNHCTVSVSRNKKGGLHYTLKDNNSNTGTFLDNTEIMGKERRVLEDGSLFTIGATSIILRTKRDT